MKLTDMGTTGLVDYVTREWIGRGIRLHQACRVIRARRGDEGERRFRLAVNAAWLRK